MADDFDYTPHPRIAARKVVGPPKVADVVKPPEDAPWFGRCAAVRGWHDGETFTGDEVILAAGTYASPAMLLRSGVGPPVDPHGDARRAPGRNRVLPVVRRGRSGRGS
jgi:hypothetical protein